MVQRFTSQELQQIVDVLELPNPLITKRGYCASALESFALLCAHLRSPNTQWALVCKYNRPQSAVSEIVNETASFINNHWGHLLDWDGSGLLHPQRLHEYAGALHDFGAPCQTILASLIALYFQELVYTGYKKCHGMKYQGVIIPNGLIGHLSGPFRAPQNDMGVLANSRLLEYLELHAIQPGSRQGDPPAHRYFQVYGDSAYSVSPVMVSPYAGIVPPTPEQRAWNMAMGGVRILVEHGFGLVLQDWPQLNCFWRQRIWGTQCRVMYRVGVLLTNARACLVPNQTSCCYGCDPPTLEEYFHVG
ncbi:hypothetical protein K439DRAFT_1647605 [Ramaria rubella]|nr:hypothetical protein K439DRAFT_1647605 [Ramaria rubella]